MINIDSFYNSQKEDEIGRVFTGLINQIDIDDD